MKHINEVFLNEMINEARDELEHGLRAKKQISNITPLQEHIAFLPVVVNYITDNYQPSEVIPAIISEAATFYVQNAISAHAKLKEEEIKQVLTILLSENWTKTKYEA